jgi:hypothetical protein
MISYWRSILAGSVCLAILAAVGSGGRTVRTSHNAQVDIVDAHGYHHQGYYDDNHDWHGGYDDEQHQHHDDPHDWHQ